MVFPVVMYGCESWTIKKAERQRIDAFELWCWRRLLRVSWTARRSNQSILKEISPGCSLEGLMLTLKLQYFGHLMGRADSLEKTLMLGKIEGGKRRGQQRMRWLDVITNTQSWLKIMSIESVMPSTISHLVVPFSSHFQSFLASGSFPMSQFFASGSQSIGDFIYNMRPSNEYSGLISFGIHCFDLLELQGTQESSPIPHFKSINSSALSFLYSPTLTSIHDCWKNHSLD